MDVQLLQSMVENDKRSMIEELKYKHAKQSEERRSIVDEWERSIKMNRMKKQLERGNFKLGASAAAIQSAAKAQLDEMRSEGWMSLTQNGGKGVYRHESVNNRREVQENEEETRSKSFDLQRRRRASTHRKKNAAELFEVDPFDSVEKERHAS